MKKAGLLGLCRLTGLHWKIVVGIGLLIRLIWILNYQPKPISDFEMYWGLGNDFAKDFFRPAGPGMSLGYPYFVALCLKLGLGLAGTLAVQAVLSAALIWALCAFAARWMGQVQAFAIALLLAFSPGMIFYTSILGTETTSAFLITLGALGMLHGLFLSHERKRLLWPWILAGGFLIGLSASFRFVLYYLPFALVLALMLANREFPWRLRLRTGALLMTGWFVAILAYCTWAYVFTGQFRIKANHGSLAFWQGTLAENKGQYSMSHGIAEANNHPDYRERDRIYYQAAFKNILADPLQYLSFGPAKVWVTLSSPGSALWWNFTLEETGLRISEKLLWVYSHWLTKYQRLFHLLLGVSFFGGLWAVFRRKSGFPVVWLASGAAIVYLMAFSFISIAADRFQIPFIPFYALFAASSPVWGALNLGGKKARRLRS